MCRSSKTSKTQFTWTRESVSCSSQVDFTHTEDFGMNPVFVFGFLMFSCVFQLLLGVHGEGDGYQEKCPPSFECGYLNKIQFPFTKAEQPNCGIFAIQNCDNPHMVKIIQPRNQGRQFAVVQVSQSSPYSITITDDNLYKSLKSKSCDVLSHNYTLPFSSPFASFQISYYVIVFKCNRTLNVKTPQHLGILNYSCSDYNNIFYYGRLTNGLRSSFRACSTVQLPIKDLPDDKDPFTFLTANIPFEVTLSQECKSCHEKNGLCRLDSNQKFYCVGDIHKKNQEEKKDNSYHVMKLIIIATAISAAGVVVLMIFLSCWLRRQNYSWTSLSSWKKENQINEMIKACLKEHRYLSIKRYSYWEITKMTNSFKNKLGHGGYGAVYKGRLQDGHHVAVKVLHELKGNGEEFINEVVGISRTSHVNIVSLLGFCFQGSKRALIYEFMHNGSLEKFIHASNGMTTDHQLNCKTLYDIAIGVARGLEYLHRGCNTKILHFDIKPHNILLDENFHPKISDFGLAKICPTKESIISISCARGTVGYIAPEVFSRNFGAISHKSDVYSYGMMVLEMIGGKKNVNAQIDCSSEIYFPHWVYKRLELNQELGLQGVISETDKETVRKMIVVSLWCIQTYPTERPAMSKVVEMLEGNVKSLQVPSKPFLSSPSASPAHHSTQTNEISDSEIAVKM